MHGKRAKAAVMALAVILAVGTGAWGLVTRSVNQQDDTAPGQTGATATADQPRNDAPPPAAGAIDQTAQAGKYRFLFFYRTDDEPTQAARRVFDAAMARLGDRAVAATANVTDPLEQATVNRLGLSRAPMPLALALAPNGAVTRSFVGQFVESQFETAFVSPGTATSLKVMQDRKMLFVCVQNGTTQHNAEAMQGVREFADDAQFAKTVEIMTLDPTDPAEAGFLEQLKVDPKTEEAVTVFMAPPGTTVGTYQGETKKDVLMAAAKTAGKGCNPKSGCCPPKKPAAPQPGSPEKKP
ncbi:MAG: hypothetical protein V2A79_10625 [Planctomycetota bacterium]